MRSLVIVFLVCFPLVVFQILLLKFWGSSSVAVGVSNFIAMYLTPLVLGYALIKYQERVL